MLYFRPNEPMIHRPYPGFELVKHLVGNPVLVRKVRWRRVLHQAILAVGIRHDEPVNNLVTLILGSEYRGVAVFLENREEL